MKKVLVLAAVAALLMSSMAFAYETKSATDASSSYTEVLKKKHKKAKKAKKPVEAPAPAAQ